MDGLDGWNIGCRERRGGATGTYGWGPGSVG